MLVLGILFLLGVSLNDAIHWVLLLGTVSLGFWGGVGGRRSGLGGRLVLAVVAGLLIGAMILTLQVLLQLGKAVTTASHETWAKPLGLARER